MLDLMQIIVHMDHQGQDNVSHVLVFIELVDGEFQKRFQSEFKLLPRKKSCSGSPGLKGAVVDTV